MTRARRGRRSSAGRARPRSRRERGPSPTSWRMHKGRMEGRAKGNAGNSERRFERRARPQRSPQSLIADHTGRLGRVRVLLFPVLLPWATPYGRSNRAVAAVTYQVRAIGQVGAGVCASACDGIAPPQPQGTIRERRRRFRRDSVAVAWPRAGRRGGHLIMRCVPVPLRESYPPTKSVYLSRRRVFGARRMAPGVPGSNNQECPTVCDSSLVLRVLTGVCR